MSLLLDLFFKTEKKQNIKKKYACKILIFIKKRRRTEDQHFFKGSANFWCLVFTFFDMFS